MEDGASSYRRFLDGDKSGLVELVAMYNKSLIFFINGIVNNLTVAEDLAADTFFELMTRRCHFKENYSFKTWLFKIGRNNAIDYLRKQSKCSDCSFEDTENNLKDSQSIETEIINNERKRYVHEALQTINTEYKVVIHLLYFEDMSYSEAAVVLKKNVKQIKNLAYRSKQALKVALEKEGFIYED